MQKKKLKELYTNIKTPESTIHNNIGFPKWKIAFMGLKTQRSDINVLDWMYCYCCAFFQAMVFLSIFWDDTCMMSCFICPLDNIKITQEETLDQELFSQSAMWACLWCFGLTINWQGSLWIAPFHMAWLEFYKSKESYLSIRWQKLSKDMCIYSLFVNVEVMLFVPFLTCSQ